MNGSDGSDDAEMDALCSLVMLLCLWVAVTAGLFCATQAVVVAKVARPLGGARPSPSAVFIRYVTAALLFGLGLTLWVLPLVLFWFVFDGVD